MKKLKFIVLFALVAGFVGCSSDDDNGSNKLNQENLIGTYNLKSFESKDVKQVEVEGFEVKTTTTSEGDTFSLTYDFDENNKVTLDGNYRVTQKKKQGSNTTDTTFIRNYNNEEFSYNLNQDEKTLTIDGEEYNVKGFSSSGFELLQSVQTISENGTVRDYTEKMRLAK